VRFWDPAWRALLFRAVDQLIDTGFDGAFLDVVDAGEYWAEEAPEAQRNPQAEQQMVELVEALAAHARVRKPGFGLFPNGGPGLGRFPAYVKVVDGLFVEDVWYSGAHRQKPANTAWVLEAVKPFRAAGKPVLAIDYPTQKFVDDFYARALAAGLVPYATVRDLDKLTVNPGHAP
jgi:cysteinyl-tRNA synthetase